MIPLHVPSVKTATYELPPFTLEPHSLVEVVLPSAKQIDSLAEALQSSPNAEHLRIKTARSLTGRAGSVFDIIFRRSLDAVVRQVSNGKLSVADLGLPEAPNGSQRYSLLQWRDRRIVEAGIAAHDADIALVGDDGLDPEGQKAVARSLVVLASHFDVAVVAVRGEIGFSTGSWWGSPILAHRPAASQ